jgi:hypothetical protein
MITSRPRGGTAFPGRRLVPRLAAEGGTLRIAVRSPERAQHILAVRMSQLSTQSGRPYRYSWRRRFADPGGLQWSVARVIACRSPTPFKGKRHGC